MSEPKITKQEFALVAAYLSAGVSRQMSKDQMRVYYDTLCDLPNELLQMAARRAIQEQKENFLPSVAAIRGYASELANGMLPTAASEWELVRAAVRRFGYPQKSEALATFRPLTRAAVDSVGWDVICASESIATQAAQFRMAYEGAANREVSMRRISQELRPRIAVGPRMTPRIEDRAEVLKLVNNFADGLTPAIGVQDEDQETVSASTSGTNRSGSNGRPVAANPEGNKANGQQDRAGRSGR